MVRHLRVLGDGRALPLVLLSALGCCLLVGRVLATHRLDFGFLAWNLLLAWTPFLLVMFTKRWRGIPGVLSAAAWLLLFPNAPYIVTDLLHLRPRAGVPYWFDVGLLSTFAWCGTLLGLASLEKAHRLVREARAGSRSQQDVAGWLFVVLVATSSGFGIYIGRFLRWNSWDAITHPGALLRDLVEHAFSARALGVTALFGALLFASYLAFRQPPAAQTLEDTGSNHA